MRRKNKSLPIVCLLVFGSFLLMASLISVDAEAASTWSIETVDSAGYVGTWSSIALDSNNHPHISYWDWAIWGDIPMDLKYAYWDGSQWQIETVDGAGGVNVGKYTSIALDTNDRPHISYFDGTNYNLKYAYFNGSQWQIETVDNAGYGGGFTSIVLDTNNRPHISYYNSADSALKYAYYNGAFWQIEIIDSEGDVGMWTSIAIDTNNRPHICYYDLGVPHTNRDLKYAYYNGLSWQIETVDSEGDVGWSTSIALDTNNRPHISYFDDTNEDLKYAYFNGSQWQIETVDGGDPDVVNVGYYSSIALDINNRPHISYWDLRGGNLKYAYFNGSQWQIETVDRGDTDVGAYSSIALDTNNRPHISYYDSADSALKYAKATTTQDALILSINKCKVKAGKMAGQDTISVSGIIDVTADEIANADEIYVEIFSDADDHLVYSEPINLDLFRAKKGKYTYKAKVAKGAAGRITSFKLDTNKGKLSLLAKNINLTGLGCPLSVEIQIGDYYWQSQADEEIVNGKKAIPIQLMSGYADTLRVDKYRVKFGKKVFTDSFSVKGGFAIEDDAVDIGDVIVTLGSQTFTVPGEEIIAHKNGVRWWCKNVYDANGIVSAKFDLAKCTFIINIKKADITESGVVDFCIAVFGRELPCEEIDLYAYRLEDLRRYDVLGAWWDYHGEWTTTIRGPGVNETEPGSGEVYIWISSDPVYFNGHPCYEVNVSGGGSSESSYWYTDDQGTHMASSGTASGLGDYDIAMDALLYAPTVLMLGKTHKASGSFDGTFDLDDPDMDIERFWGKASTSCKLLGREQVTVTAGTFDAVKAQVSLKLTGKMRGTFFDERFTAKFSASVKQTWWGVPDVGIVKSETEAFVRVSLWGVSVTITITETDVLTDYGD